MDPRHWIKPWHTKIKYIFMDKKKTILKFDLVNHRTQLIRKI